MLKWITGLVAGLVLATSSAAMETAGDWHGELNIQPGVSLPLVLHIAGSEPDWQVSLDSPNQGAFGIPGSAGKMTDTQVTLKFAAIGASYEAALEDGKLAGTFTQSGKSFALTLARQSEEGKEKAKQAAARPQHPEAPFPYTVEEVSYPHTTGAFEFAATLTLPDGKGPFPAAILVSGSGPQDRDETLMGHKPFLVIADHLTKAGIAVLRFDDRGTAKSGGTFAGATIYDFSTDVASAFEYLNTRDEINQQKIGLIGHSEGGVTAPLFAARQPDVAFVVLLAGLGVDGTTLWAEQQRDMAVAYGLPNGEAIYQAMRVFAEQVIAGESPQAIEQDLLSKGYDKATAQQYLKVVANEWGRSFLTYQPEEVLPKLTMPVLALNGEKDLQVAAATNIGGMEAIFASSENEDVTLKILPDLNHLFQQAESGLPDEYGRINQTFAPQALLIISGWISNRVGE
jgi:pimeloyl-ACP methyl ester carboxylesterase